MWSINYENPHKLHMSIGIGLMVAAFLLFLSNTYFSYGSLDKLSDSIKDDSSFIKSLNLSENDISLLSDSLDKMRAGQSNFIMSNLKDTNIMTIVLLVLGFIFFSVGYIPFLKSYIHSMK
ncbi:MAG: hypothetical protein NT001_06395 [Candidatus Woesearchaeota archaeon]|nr:hypothetical protein [Candidatus Woesearchaeota archaeon]